MNEVGLCINDLQHCFVALPKRTGMASHSCPTCGALVYWSETLLKWVKPGTSGGKEIPGNVKKK